MQGGRNMTFIENIDNRRMSPFSIKPFKKRKQKEGNILEPMQN